MSLADGSSFQVPLSVTGVQTASDESTYEHPFVMVCCTDIRDAEGWPFDDTCDTRQHEACMSDFIQHVCNAPGNWLAATADDFLFDGKEAIQAAAKWLDDHKLEGPELGGSLVRGTGDVGTGSVLEWTTGEAGTRKIERWVMTEAAATSVGTESSTVRIDHFKLTLALPVTAKAREGGWHVEPDVARFVLGATVEGQGSSVQATNATGIELRTVAGGTGPCPSQASACTESGPFTITYIDETKQSWTLHAR